MLGEYKRLIESDAYNDFYTYVNLLTTTGRRKLLGIGISDVLTVKLYQEMQSIDEVLSGSFFNESTKELVERYSKNQICNTSSSLAIGVKINAAKTKKYFHVKVPEDVEIPVPIKQLWRFKLWRINSDKLMKGISIEGDNLKSYFYLQSKSDIASFIALNRISVDSRLLNHIELYFTDDNFKYNLIFEEATPEHAKLVLTNREIEILDSLQPLIERPILYAGRSSGEATAYYSFTPSIR